jgi:stearoyl-CoA desaturase (delta-9 desaturase)
VLVWHGTFTINSLSHLFGSRRYQTTDTSKNNLLLALVTLGEGWHNNHHHFMAAARQGFFWWEIDITYYTLKAMSWLGLVWELRKVPVHMRVPEEQKLTA